MKPSFRAFAVTALCLLTGVSCRLDSAPAMPGPSGPHGTSDPALDPNRIVMPAPERTPSTRTGVQSGADAADDGSAGQGGGGVSVATVADGGDGGRGGSSGAHAGGAQTGGESGGVASSAGAGGVAMMTGGAGDVGGHAAGGAGAGAAGKVASGGSGGRSQPQAGRGGGGMRGPAGNGSDDAATFNELIDKLSNALTAEQRARIVQALTTNSVTPDQLNELLDAVTKAGSCEDGHDSCQQMCRLVLNACPTCMLDRMTAEMEQARCDSL